MKGERQTAELDGDFVVFLIGMRVNQWWRVDAWLPVFLAMPRMLAELQGRRDLGLLGGQFHGFTLVQYWRSAAELQVYAHAGDLAHFPAWRAFGRKSRSAGGAVGIWHETFLVAAGQYETVYVNMPPTGLGRAGTLRPAVGRRETAAGRLQEQ